MHDRYDYGLPMTNILIVDDKPYVRELLKEALPDERYRVVTTANQETLTEITDAEVLIADDTGKKF
jgi:CheY-like chemotaxis protein